MVKSLLFIRHSGNIGWTLYNIATPANTSARYVMKNQSTPVLANIFSALPDQLPEELFECLLKREDLLIERIISKGHITPEGQWYDQAWDEWVILLQGQATLSLCCNRQDEKLISLVAGDYLLIPAHTRHRVEWTSTEQAVVWLAIHLHKPGL